MWQMKWLNVDKSNEYGWALNQINNKTRSENREFRYLRIFLYEKE